MDSIPTNDNTVFQLRKILKFAFPQLTKFKVHISSQHSHENFLGIGIYLLQNKLTLCPHNILFHYIKYILSYLHYLCSFLYPVYHKWIAQLFLTMSGNYIIFIKLSNTLYHIFSFHSPRRKQLLL